MKILFINLLILSRLQDQGRVLYFAFKQLHYFNLQGISVDIDIALDTTVAIGKVYLAIAYAIDMTLATAFHLLAIGIMKIQFVNTAIFSKAKQICPPKRKRFAIFDSL